MRELKKFTWYLCLALLMVIVLFQTIILQGAIQDVKEIREEVQNERTRYEEMHNEDLQRRGLEEQGYGNGRRTGDCNLHFISTQGVSLIMRFLPKTKIGDPVVDSGVELVFCHSCIHAEEIQNIFRRRCSKFNRLVLTYGFCNEGEEIERWATETNVYPQ